MSPDVQPPIIERYGYTWIQHPDGLYYGPRYPSDEAPLIALEEAGRLGHHSVRRGGHRYVLRHPEDEAPRANRFGWQAGDLTITHPDSTQESV